MSVKNLAKKYASLFSGPAKKIIEWRPVICPYDEILEFVPDRSTVLDIGCGSGFFLYCAGIEKRCKILEGVDVDKKKLLVLKKNLVNVLEDSDVELHAAKTAEGWPKKEFDVVTLIDVLHHVPRSQQKDFLKEAAGRVRKGGILIYKDISTRKLLYAAINTCHDLLISRQCPVYLKISIVNQSLLDLGFSSVAYREVKMLWYCHDILVMRRN